MTDLSERDKHWLVAHAFLLMPSRLSIPTEVHPRWRSTRPHCPSSGLRPAQPSQPVLAAVWVKRDETRAALLSLDRAHLGTSCRAVLLWKQTGGTTVYTNLKLKNILPKSMGGLKHSSWHISFGAWPQPIGKRACVRPYKTEFPKAQHDTR